MYEVFFGLMILAMYTCAGCLSFHLHLEKYKEITFWDILQSCLWPLDVFGYCFYVIYEVYKHRKPLKPLDWFNSY